MSISLPVHLMSADGNGVDDGASDSSGDEEISYGDQITLMFHRLVAMTRTQLSNSDCLDLREVMGHKDLVYSLCLRKVCLFTCEEFKKILPKFSGLEELDLSTPPLEEDEIEPDNPPTPHWAMYEINSFLRIFKDCCKNLHRLDLDYVQDLSISDVIELATSNPEIAELSLRNCLTLRDEHLEELAEMLSQLRSLSLGGCSEVTGDGVRQLIQNNPELQHLDLSHLHYLSTEQLLSLAPLTGELQSLDLRGIEGFTEEVYYAFLEANPQLSDDAFLWACESEATNEIEDVSEDEEDAEDVGSASDPDDKESDYEEDSEYLSD